ncbi:MAG: hypothetical protein R3C05_22525 [Pirellulaceae bacterium]
MSTVFIIMFSQTRRVPSLACFASLIACVAVAADQDQQRYRVRVPGLVAINATSNSVSIEHDQTDSNQAFDWQSWQVVCNNTGGATVTFETDQAFTHTMQSDIRRDAFLFLSTASGGGLFRRSDWQITRFADQTDYKNGDQTATVSAEVDRARDGTFNLRVVFLEEQFADTVAGVYELTVTGTIVPK